MNKPLILKNTIQKYAWGSRSAIQGLLGEPATQDPWAELWMGAHPKAPSQVNSDGEWLPLDRMIKKYPIEILGDAVAKKFNNTLPYLFKLLAADQPLSIQAHPNMIQAKQGFERENRLNIPLNAPHRNYKDMYHKPECICALTPFTALKGFRRVPDLHRRLKALCPVGLNHELNVLAAEGQSGLKGFFNALLTLPQPRKRDIITEAVEKVKSGNSQDDTFKSILDLYQKYPDDIGILSPAILNLVTLNPGEALFLHARELHAYISGLGIELMANSDNVLRGGLTPKYIDPPELLNVLNFSPTDIDILLPENTASGEKVYPVFAQEFSLSVISFDPGHSYTAPPKHSADILLCTSGSGSITCDGNTAPVQFTKGTSVLVPAILDSYQVAGNGVIYKAGVPL